MDRRDLHHHLPAAIAKLVESVRSLPSMRRLDRATLPSRDNAEACIGLLLDLVFPGYFGRQGLTEDNLLYRAGEIAMAASELLYEQVRFCLRYRLDRPDDARDGECQKCDTEAARISAAFFDRLPDVRSMLADDVQAAFESDPAATSVDETIFCYPGVYAIAVLRLAHELWSAGVPLLPRIWTELAHSRTGIDIHPGAKLGRRFFIDHGTGVVIGETTTLGANVKVYQGVTLGALAPAYGQMLRGTKRHPTIEDDVTIYAHATILGGDTVIGSGSVIGGNVFITKSVPANSVVLMEDPKLRIRERGKKKSAGSGPGDFDLGDFQI
jgi:serine O-acetyltransferase